MTARKVGTLALEYCLGLAPRSDRWLAEQELEERSREAASTAAECARLRAALDTCAANARGIMECQGYAEDRNSEWLGPRLHAILDASTAGVKP